MTTITEYRNDLEKLINVVEHRTAFVGGFEFREDKATGQYILEGYAATYEPYDCHGGPAAGGWVEQLSRTAFDETLAEQPDVQLLINHGGEPLARTKSGTMKLSRDHLGLRVWASLDPTDPDVKRLAPKMKRGDMDEMSFAFRVTDHDWDNNYSHRTIQSLSLQKGDVSVVNYGMNPGTHAELSQAVGTLAQLSTRELVELRGMVNHDQAKRAAAVLAAIGRPPAPAAMGSVAPAALPPARQIEPRKDDEPHGNVTYADPGYKTDGKKRYPIDTEKHVKAAWSYINMPKNQKGYSSGQVNSIKGRIKTAAKKFGVEISDGEGKSAVVVSHIDQVLSADGNLTLAAVLSNGTRVVLPAQRAIDAPGGWNPNATNADPHDDPYKKGTDGKMPGLGPVPDNIMGGALKKNDATVNLDTNEDVHNQSMEQERQMSMDTGPVPGNIKGGSLVGAPLSEMYDFGPYPGGGKVTPQHMGGGDPHDTPYDVGTQIGGGPQGAVADNIVVQGSGRGGGDGLGAPVLGHPDVGTAPVAEGGGKLYDWTGGNVGSESPAEDLNSEAVRPGIGSRGSDMPYNPETGEGRSDDMDETDCDNPDDEHIELDLGLADALDKTILHAYKLAEGNTEVRRVLGVAQRQLNAMRGIAPKANSDISNMLAELRAEVGVSDAATVTEGLRFLRSAGTAPVGYRGLLDHDPELHITTPSERLARDAVEKDRRARQAAQESDLASDRLKRARREAELNDAIRRNRKAV